MTIPEHIKQKIKANASWNDDEQESIRNMEYGYSLAQEEITRITECHDGLKADLERCKKVAQEEIERLKGLIKKLWNKDIDTGYDHLYDEETMNYYWQQFKQKNNL